MHLIQAFRCPVESIRGCLPSMECSHVPYVKLYGYGRVNINIHIILWVYIRVNIYT